MRKREFLRRFSAMLTAPFAAAIAGPETGGFVRSRRAFIGIDHASPGGDVQGLVALTHERAHPVHRIQCAGDIQPGQLVYVNDQGFATADPFEGVRRVGTAISDSHDFDDGLGPIALVAVV